MYLRSRRARQERNRDLRALSFDPSICTRSPRTSCYPEIIPAYGNEVGGHKKTIYCGTLLYAK